MPKTPVSKSVIPLLITICYLNADGVIKVDPEYVENKKGKTSGENRFYWNQIGKGNEKKLAYSKNQLYPPCFHLHFVFTYRSTKLLPTSSNLFFYFEFRKLSTPITSIFSLEKRIYSLYARNKEDNYT